MFTMFFLVKLTIAIVIVCGILSPILVSPHNKLSTLFWKIPNAFWIFLICIYFAIAMAVLIESSEQTRIRRQQYFWICPYISRHLLSLNPLLACCRRYSRGER